MSGKDLANMLDVDAVGEMWKNEENAYNHIARLPYDNRARMVLYGNKYIKTKVLKGDFLISKER